MINLEEKIAQTVTFLKKNGVEQADFGLILGSGLGELAEEITDAKKIPFEKIPYFPISTVTGHAGNLVCGILAGKKVIAMQGRFHYYEGHSMQTVTYPVRIMAALGVHALIVTNAAGGVNQSFIPGDLMLITDHINFTGNNPLIGPNDEKTGPHFPDMSHAYSENFQTIANQVAAEQGIKLQQGVYMGFSGPTYETPAEIRMSRAMGADAVGMSTVSEVIVAVHSGLEVLGISCITNLAAGMQNDLNHTEVVETTQRVKVQFKYLVKEILAKL
ncbi:purine-nucleoside phosphorylase [Melissococcus plutonius]|uniref:Purine nucleoside phosphorylase n=1 Tax=Melissococcus plutonius (strain ATCC 35311 / DSM 29964 / CIP 104052 / LMG 20360 / NCIMB 702443) TaxID=940190 RepID=F3Y8A3_MELPT|nr:purine-nucleoside phosphorylase [Melissococcus plutonius]AIM24448.1 purine nucleoside phosphorylase 1 [Melissococcus plutonius S1]KMT27205.1 purine nucleoside phosphorylase 1 [Melissococcus plutonius]KMT28306.1 purine nucleoside phosphorylase 1 [Melissococcus plutonius]KMT30042.1 purine nucleoside phosphorylase 1 [Melissococcus plutonius]KMT30706.1 purine nucleoside phosphorylase 1 [Melissococcus plutonius]